MDTKSNEWQITSKKNVRKLIYWSLGWALTTAMVRTGANFLWDHSTGISTLGVVISTLIGIGMILMNRKYINGLDEMHRKVMMEALALALGVGVVGGECYALLGDTDLIPFDVKVSWVTFLMAVTYAIAYIVGSNRYK